jgi:hypothetical protein
VRPLRGADCDLCECLERVVVDQLSAKSDGLSQKGVVAFSPRSPARRRRPATVPACRPHRPSRARRSSHPPRHDRVLAAFAGIQALSRTEGAVRRRTRGDAARCYSQVRFTTANDRTSDIGSSYGTTLLRSNSMEPHERLVGGAEKSRELACSFRRHRQFPVPCRSCGLPRPRLPTRIASRPGDSPECTQALARQRRTP